MYWERRTSRLDYVRQHNINEEDFLLDVHVKKLSDPGWTRRDDYITNVETLPEVWMSSVEVELFLWTERERSV